MIVFFKAEQLRKMEVTVESSTKSAVRSAIVSGRCYEDRENMVNGPNVEKTGSIIMCFKGIDTVVGGHGEIFEKFRAHR